MRPLGVRDGAKLVGGLGPCGRGMCCATFMDRFHSVTVRMAKRQNLTLNPSKISGMCGRLMCCLAHEVDQYPAPKQRRG
jgi:cell fate regulator YaaT (PSP1 superfamily)